LVQEVIRDKVIDEQCRRNPLHWLQHHTKTRDDHWRENGTELYRKFPDWPYFPRLFELMQSERRLFLPKSREMMLSWAVMAYAVWLAQWHNGSQIIVQSEKSTKSIDLVGGTGVSGYCLTLWEQQDACLKRLHPLTKRPEDMAGDLITWKNDSSIRAVPGGADQVRQYHPALFIMDEACFLTEAAASYDTAEPVTTQIIAVSSAGPSWYGEVCQSILDGA
jgi:hypothetical protein